MANRKLIVTTTGGPSVLQLQSFDIPTPTSTQLTIKAAACGVNFADVMARKGFYPDAPKLPTCLGYEVSGTVYSVGPEVTKFKVGDEIVAFTRFDSQADYCIAEEAFVALKPASLSFIDAASIPVVYVTAYMLLVHLGGIKKDDTVLIQNAGGGVGLAAIDICRKYGAKSIGTASGKKHQFLKERGLDVAIDYRNENVNDRVLELTDGKGVDLIIDPIGGYSWRSNYDLLRKGKWFKLTLLGGRLGMFGASLLADVAELNFFSKAIGLLSFLWSIPKWSPLNLMDDNKAVFGVNLGKMWDEVERFDKIVT